MARIDTLANFLTDVATAIKNKTGKTDAITPANFDTEIESIESGGDGSGKYAPRYISFYYYSGTDLNEELSNLDTSNITSMDYMFYMARNLTSLDVSGFNTSNVTMMSSTFRQLEKLTSLDLSSFDTSKIKNMYYTFAGCIALQHLDVRSFTFTNVTGGYTSIFESVPKACEIIVKDDEQKAWVLARRSDFTNVKTVAEYEGG